MRDGACRSLTRTTRTALTTLCLGDAAALNPERLSSYQEPHGAWSVNRCFLPGYPREIRSVAHPFARRDSATARQSCLGSARARPAVHRYLSVLATNEPEMRLADVCNPHVKDEHPNEPRGFRLRCRGGPRSHRRTVPTRGDRPLWPDFRRSDRSFIPAEACHGTRSADVSVTAPNRARCEPARFVSAKTASTAAQRDELRLVRPETPSTDRGTLRGSFPDPRQRFPPSTGSRSLFCLRRFLATSG